MLGMQPLVIPPNDVTMPKMWKDEDAAIISSLVLCSFEKLTPLTWIESPWLDAPLFSVVYVILEVKIRGTPDPELGRKA